MTGFSGAIFDLDGTLLDSMGVWEEIDAAFLNRRGFEVPADYLQAVAPLGFRAAADYTIRRFGLRESAEALIEEWDTLAVEAYQVRVPLKSGARQYLLSLKERGVRLAVATASREAYYVPALKTTAFMSGLTPLPPFPRWSGGRGIPTFIGAQRRKSESLRRIARCSRTFSRGSAARRREAFIPWRFTIPIPPPTGPCWNRKQTGISKTSMSCSRRIRSRPHQKRIVKIHPPTTNQRPA